MVDMEYSIWIERIKLFDEEWYVENYPDVLLSNLRPIEHYARYGALLKRNPSSSFDTLAYMTFFPEVNFAKIIPLVHFVETKIQQITKQLDSTVGCENIFNSDLSLFVNIIAPTIIESSALFDREYYLANNADVERAGVDPLVHYCEYGWLEMRNPSHDFDNWWYTINYLDISREDINPLLYYALIGRGAGHIPIPEKKTQNRLGTGLTYPEKSKNITRICLYAGYDKDGIVDDYVVSYLKELYKFADIYYLADSLMEKGEIDKITPFVKGVWCDRHGQYDFGSYSKLANEYVGWDKIEEYDELIFANDSCYCIRPFSSVFEKMDQRQCDWWGLQATKGIAYTRNSKTNDFKVRISITQVKENLLNSFEDDYFYDFLIGSYFTVFRKDVICNKNFQHLVNSVKKEKNKLQIIARYEIGLTRFLINAGYEFDTFIDHLYPFHPIYTDTHFELIEEGFPLLKRYFLTENHYKVSDLYKWKERLLDLVPTADSSSIEQNIHRISNNEKLYRNLHITQDSEGTSQYQQLLSYEEISKKDLSVEKHDNWWVFPVCGFNHTLAGNERAVFDFIKNDASIKKIILTRSRYVDVDGSNVVVVPLNSLEGQYYLLRSRVIFIKHTPTRNITYSLSSDLHCFINLWHGIPLKRIGAASLDQQSKLKNLYEEHKKCTAVIASSKIDQMAMASAFYPLTYNDVWVTGLPRNDYIVCNDDYLPEDMKIEERSIRQMLQGRRLVFYAPTFRNGQHDSYYHFSMNEKNQLKSLFDEHNCVLGIREHLADKASSYSEELKDIGALNLSDKRFPNIEIIYRCTDLLITDYSSCFIDFMLTGKPLMSFAYDYDHYISAERGLFYDMPKVFPGPICKSFKSLIHSLVFTLAENTESTNEKYQYSRSVFFDFIDDDNASRVVSRVKSFLKLPDNNRYFGAVQ